MGKRRSALTVRVGDHAQETHDTTITKPRTAWALERLMSAGERGCTPIETPGPRWSGYVPELRHRHGIETIHESHGGEFPGSHGRYRLISKVIILERAESVATDAIGARERQGHGARMEDSI